MRMSSHATWMDSVPSCSSHESVVCDPSSGLHHAANESCAPLRMTFHDASGIDQSRIEKGLTVYTVSPPPLPGHPDPVRLGFLPIRTCGESPPPPRPANWCP